MRNAFLLSLLILASLLPPTWAQETVTRILPANVQYSTTAEPQTGPYVAFDDGFWHKTKIFRVAPGVGIFDTNNRLIPLSALPQGVKVGYTLDINSEVQRIYVLTASEIAALK